MKGRSKFGNRIVQVDGLTFHSAKEARRWTDLNLLARAGEITELQRQVRFPMVVNGQDVCAYVADFTYLDAGVLVVEDVKSPPTRAEASYRLKRKLLKACHGLDVRET